MLQDPESVLRAWYEQVWNQGREAAIDELLADDAKAHGLVDAEGNTARGPASFKQVFHTFRTAFPDLCITLDEVVAQRDICAVRCTVRGTHLGDSLGIPATGKKVEFTGMNFARISEGKIVEGWNNFDFATMQAQLQ
ncbi:ester cyclase [Armatimonas rosea]|uniref:Steroid delta-isomerase-like uncharacterized protein n=1 Tax=Armatimonas rosea TaxID=685828 RepID=A0A7W9W5S0_ARMRO|nr:ester cyclase [Armatimonas rosea]MBB6049863.1 steroid delta-isomerase-like uncharacterized protein [Armatimonas rosea]